MWFPPKPKQTPIQSVNPNFTNAVLQRIENKIDNLTKIVQSIEWIQQPDVTDVNAGLDIEGQKIQQDQIPF
jgi:hypothetical protein